MRIIKITDLTEDALRKVLHSFADIRGIPHSPMIDKYERVDLEIHAQSSLEIVSRDLTVTIQEDGTIETSPLPRPETERRTSPGLARMRANLGTEGTENLRKQVVSDGDAALEAASKRSDYMADTKEAGGDAAEAAAGAAPEVSNPQAAAVVGSAVARAIEARTKSVPEILKILNKETSPQAREILKDALAAAQKRDAQATKTQATVPPPRKPASGAPLTPRGKITLSDSDVIHLRVPAGTNPKRSTAGARFAKYVHGMTVKEYAEAIGDAGQAGRDIAWDQSKGWITIVPTGESGE